MDLEVVGSVRTRRNQFKMLKLHIVNEYLYYFYYQNQYIQKV